jgi:hypothetical protein
MQAARAGSNRKKEAWWERRNGNQEKKRSEKRKLKIYQQNESGKETRLALKVLELRQRHVRL